MAIAAGRSENTPDSPDDGLPIDRSRCHSQGERAALGTASALPDQSKLLTQVFGHRRTSPGLQPWARFEGGRQSDELRQLWASHSHRVHGTFLEGRRSMIP